MSPSTAKRRRNGPSLRAKHKELIVHLYCHQLVPLHKIVATMKNDYDFTASEAAFKQQLSRWKVSRPKTPGSPSNQLSGAPQLLSHGSSAATVRHDEDRDTTGDSMSISSVPPNETSLETGSARSSAVQSSQADLRIHNHPTQSVHIRTDLMEPVSDPVHGDESLRDTSQHEEIQVSRVSPRATSVVQGNSSMPWLYSNQYVRHQSWIEQPALQSPAQRNISEQQTIEAQHQNGYTTTFQRSYDVPLPVHRSSHPTMGAYDPIVTSNPVVAVDLDLPKGAETAIASDVPAPLVQCGSQTCQEDQSTSQVLAEPKSLSKHQEELRNRV